MIEKAKSLLSTMRKSSIHYVVLFALLLMAMDFVVRYLSSEAGILLVLAKVSANIFTREWIILFVFILLVLRGVWRRIAYWIIIIFNLIMFVTQCIYYELTDVYFGFHLLQSADEGSGYILGVIKNTNPWVFVLTAIFLVAAIIIGRGIMRVEPIDKKIFVLVIVLIIVIHYFTPNLLGKKAASTEWDNFNNARNTYENFSDSNGSMQVAGFYEYTFRNAYITFIKPKEKMSSEEKKTLDRLYKPNNDENAKNKYTGIFKGKNIILLQMEGLDTWLLNKEFTPTLYSLRKSVAKGFAYPLSSIC